MNGFVQKAAAWGPALVFLAAMFWATDAPFRSELTEGLPSTFIVFGEHLFALAVAVPVLVVFRRELARFSMREWLALLVIGVGGSALASMAFTEAFHYVNPSVAVLLQKVQPLIVIALAATMLRETFSRVFWLWAAVALFGAYLVSFPQLIPQLYAGEVFNPNTMGVLLSLSAALLWGASTVMGKYMLKSASFQTVTALRFIIAFIFLGCLNLYQGTFTAVGTVSPRDWLFMAIIALASGVFSLFLYYYGLQYTKASIATIAELGYPLAAVVVNAYFIAGIAQPGTTLGLYLGQWLGSVLLLFALYMLSRVNRSEEAPVL